MVLVRILKRKDASSVIVAIVLAFIVAEVVSRMTVSLAGKLSGIGSDLPAFAWRGSFAFPILSLILQVIVLEILVRAAIIIRAALVRGR